MKIRNLVGISLAELIDCLLQAFSGYYVKMPSDLEYWGSRFKAARVDPQLSFGMFDEQQLVGFIINGIDQHNNQLTAFNTGTGVLPDYRGKSTVDHLYAHALPIFRNYGIQKCMLEVIRENDRAIKVYERIGFELKRNLYCFGGDLEKNSEGVGLLKADFKEVMQRYPDKHHLYSWDFTWEAILRGGEAVATYVVQNEHGKEVGYFCFNERAKMLARIETANGTYDDILNALSSITSSCKINNVDESRQDLMTHLKSHGLRNSVNQFEMEMLLR